MGPTIRRSVRSALASVLLASLILPATRVHAATIPGPPTNVTAAAGDGVVLLSWLPPADDGGSPITAYVYGVYAGGVLILSRDVDASQTSVLLGENEIVFNDLSETFDVTALNAIGSSGAVARTAEVTPVLGAPFPRSAIALIPASGGVLTTDPAAVGPTPGAPITTEITVPATATGGSLTIAQTTVSEAPTGYAFLGQDIAIVSTAATDALHPLRLVFRVDPSLTPVTIFRDGLPVETPCSSADVATPVSPCIASGAGSATITILSAAASVWNVGIARYAFYGFASPVDNEPVVNTSKAGSVVPVRFGLGGDKGLRCSLPSRPRRIACPVTRSLRRTRSTQPSARPRMSSATAPVRGCTNSTGRPTARGPGRVVSS